MIEATRATQVRTKLYKDVIDAYRKDLECGAIFPPVDVFAEKGSQRFILADGFHRLYATIHAGIEEIEVTLHEGGMHEALIFALGANAGHGLRRSNADKINAVKLALKDPEISEYTQQEIADICRVTRETVSRVGRRETLGENDDNGDNGTKSQELEENEPDNIRPCRPAPTQVMVDRDELRQAMSLIRAFPYGGDGTRKLGLSQDDIANVNYCIDWLTEVLEAHVAAQYEPGDLRDAENRVATEQ